MSDRLAYVNGRIVPLSEACIGISDRGFLYGDGLFETIRAVGGRCIRIDHHLIRLSSGARVLGIENFPDASTLKESVAYVLDANGLSDARVRLTVTRGASTGPGLMGRVSGSPTVVVTATNLPTAEPEPARVIISSIRRDERSPLSSVKSLNYLPGILALHEARRAGVDDAILLNTQGNVAGGAVANVFLVMGHTLVTPSLDQGALPGTVRQAIIELGPGRGLEVVERPVCPEELLAADEVFFTNAIQLVRPIREVDGVLLGVGKWPISEHLRLAVTG
ncbi:MAG: aminodeoxychorismate lyase [Armatimonadetes bacterium]|nr:aminodeoxychorismate lyase [Armatimonadota bacterium]